jgi:pimeloyl-ACP methyl ester carboxylesterase
MAYKEWGDPHNPNVLVCVHGVTRVGDDFDLLARDLARTYRVVCPDVVGRGRSDWLANAAGYQLPQYLSDMVTLLARLNAETVDWVGTSMGGLIGLALASMKGNPIRKLVLNDIGPTLNPTALQRIGSYIGQAVSFSDFDQAATYIKSISSTFGPHTDDEWNKLAGDVLRQGPDGHWIRHYDLKLAVPFQEATVESTKMAEAMLWQAYDSIACPTLLIRGEHSDLLTAETSEAMAARGPQAEVVVVPGVGHAPTLMHAHQIEIVKRFLLG